MIAAFALAVIVVGNVVSLLTYGDTRYFSPRFPFPNENALHFPFFFLVNISQYPKVSRSCW